MAIFERFRQPRKRLDLQTTTATEISAGMPSSLQKMARLLPSAITANYVPADRETLESFFGEYPSLTGPIYRFVDLDQSRIKDTNEITNILNDKDIVQDGIPPVQGQVIVGFARYLKVVGQELPEDVKNAISNIELDNIPDVFTFETSANKKTSLTLSQLRKLSGRRARGNETLTLANVFPDIFNDKKDSPTLQLDMAIGALAAYAVIANIISPGITFNVS